MPDLSCRPRDADGADEQSHRTLLSGEEMFDEGTDLGALAIGFRGAFRHRAAFGFLGVDVRDKTVSGKSGLVRLRPIGGTKVRY